jgi:hypothetical protein
MLQMGRNGSLKQLFSIILKTNISLKRQNDAKASQTELPPQPQNAITHYNQTRIKQLHQTISHK